MMQFGLIADLAGLCLDRMTKCKGLAKNGECLSNPYFMSEKCPLSCNLCKDGMNFVLFSRKRKTNFLEFSCRLCRYAV